MALRKFLTIILLIVVCMSGISQLTANKPKYTMAFGYVANNTQNSSYNFLEQIFPNNFANTLRFKFDANVIKPFDLEKIFSKNNKKFKKQYKVYEIPEIVRMLDVDCFISGNFTPLAENKIKIVLHVYKKGSPSIFTFTIIGKLETEIFNLVDQISKILVDYLSDEIKYKTARVMPGAKIGILTNATREHLNLLYYPFLMKGYKIACITGNTIDNAMSDFLVQKFWHISTEDNKHDIISDPRKVQFLSGTWTGEKYVRRVKEVKRLFRFYDLEYLKSKNAILGKLAKIYAIDHLLIVGFYEGSVTKAWLRCIRLSDNNLMLMHGEITGSDPRQIGASIVTLLTEKNTQKK